MLISTASQEKRFAVHEVTRCLINYFFGHYLAACSDPVDVAFLMTSDRSVSDWDYPIQNNFVMEVAQFLGVAPDKSQAAVVLYSDSASVKARLGQYATIDELGAAVNAFPRQYGSRRNLDEALRVAASELARGRRSVPKLILLTSSGYTHADLYALSETSQGLRIAGIYILAVGIGRTGYQLGEELQLVTGTDENVFMATGFRQLMDYTVRIVERTCYLIGKLISEIDENYSACCK